MAKWPDSPKSYPVTPKAYPGTPKGYPGPGIAAFPTGVVVARTPLEVFGSSLLQWVRSDLGVTVVTGVSQWADQSGAGLHYTQATDAAQPTLTASDATLNNRPVLSFDNTDDFMDSALTLPAPGTTPTFIGGMIKLRLWTLNDSIVCDITTAQRIQVRQRATSPGISQTSSGVTTANENSALTLNNWGRMEAFFNNATTDYMKLRATTVTGTSAGNIASAGGRRIGAVPGASAFTALDIAELYHANRLPTEAERLSLDAYFTSLYGSGLV